MSLGEGPMLLGKAEVFKSLVGLFWHQYYNNNLEVSANLVKSEKLFALSKNIIESWLKLPALRMGNFYDRSIGTLARRHIISSFPHYFSSLTKFYPKLFPADSLFPKTFPR
jgi:hypothetical protein